MANKLTYTLEFDAPEGVTKTRMKAVVNAAIDEALTEARMEKWPHAGATFKVKDSKEDQRLAEQARTIQEKTEALAAAESRLLELSAKLDQMSGSLQTIANSEARKSVVNTVNVLIHAINSTSYQMETASQQKLEYMKAGGQQVLKQLNAAVRNAGMALVMDAPQSGDDELFIYWITQASFNPLRIMKAISGCAGADDYRVALLGLMDEDKARLSDSSRNLLFPEGGA